MYVIKARNVNDALVKGVSLINREGELISSRNGDTLALGAPVTTVYEKPWERVLCLRDRDANPFFHLMESLWILKGRDDVKFLTEFNKRMADYSDDGVTFNAAYGFRMRNGVAFTHDQIKSAVDVLNSSTGSRQVVIQIWDDADLKLQTKDKACNMSVVFRVRPNGKLTMTVYNRSNDMLWGAYGANVVQFSMLHEYVAAHTNLEMGEYYQVSNDFHVYLGGPGGALWEKMSNYNFLDANIYDSMLGAHTHMEHHDMVNFDHDLNQFFELYDRGGISNIADHVEWKSDYFLRLVLPMLSIFVIHKNYSSEDAMCYLSRIKDTAWQLACRGWLANRVENRKSKENQ